MSIDRRLEARVLGSPDSTRSRKTDNSRVLPYKDTMTLQYCISGVTNPIENHSCLMIIPLLNTSKVSMYSVNEDTRQPKLDAGSGGSVHEGGGIFAVGLHRCQLRR